MVENERLDRAYLLKEQAMDIFEEKDEITALHRLERWFQNVKEAGLAQFEAVVRSSSRTAMDRELLQVSADECCTRSFQHEDQYHQTMAYGFHDL